jgi:hypothetical protein
MLLEANWKAFSHDCLKTGDVSIGYLSALIGFSIKDEEND